MLTLLFDIDGTLLNAGGAGLRAMQKTMVDLFAIDDRLDLTVHGRTDHSIVSDFFAQTSLDVDEHRQQFCERYCQLLEPTLSESSGAVLPGVAELLGQLGNDSSIAIGLLTGNMRKAADAKLRHFGLANYFDFGGYGDDHSHRNDVAAVAYENARRHLGQRFQSDNVWVIGDTRNDIVCARSVNARVVAVETGGGTPDELKKAGPDVQYSRLPDPDQFLDDLAEAASAPTDPR